MRIKEHLMLGAALGISMGIAVKGAGSRAVFGIAIPCMIGSVWPDIDAEDSLIELLTGPVPTRFRNVFGHRKFAHSLLHLFLVNAIASHVLKPLIFYQYVITAFSIGFLSHLILDCFTDGGVPLFFPLTPKICLSRLMPDEKKQQMIMKICCFLLLLACVLFPNRLTDFFDDIRGIFF